MRALEKKNLVILYGQFSKTFLWEDTGTTPRSDDETLMGYCNGMNP
jgi:hypothetical protein